MNAALVAERDALSAAIATDRVAAGAEMAESGLAELKARVAEETARDSAAAAAEQNAPSIRVD
jgi:hypothetical protein